MRYSRNKLRGEPARAPTCLIQDCTPCPTPALTRPGNSLCSVAISIAVKATLRSGTGNSDPDADSFGPRQGGSRRGDAALEKAVLPQPQLLEAGLVGRLCNLAAAVRAPFGARKPLLASSLGVILPQARKSGPGVYDCPTPPGRTLGSGTGSAQVDDARR